MDDIHENDLVVLLVDQPETDLHRGDVGTVIQLFESTAAHPAGFIVEFVDETGRVRAETEIIDRTQIVKLRFKLDLEAA
jgi:alpha-D-ribose 1-methylphosphonate 5-triphosphate synthase subunit PhnL